MNIPAHPPQATIFCHRTSLLVAPQPSEIRNKTSPSMINLKSPALSRKNSRAMSPSPYNLSPASSVSPRSLPSSSNISPDYNINTTSNDSPEFEGDPSPNHSSKGSIFSFNTPEPSTNTTPVLTPVLTPRSPRSPLSRSLMSFSMRPQRPVSPLVINNPTDGKGKEEYEPLQLGKISSYDQRRHCE